VPSQSEPTMSEIRAFLGEIARGLKSFDDEKIAPTIKRGPNKGKSYPAGAGSHEEPDQVSAIATRYGWAANNISYSQGTCDLHQYGIWAEIKLIRPFNANGTRSRECADPVLGVVNDAKKLSLARDCARKMVVGLAYDKDKEGSTVMPFINCVRVLARNHGVSLGEPILISLGPLVHPVHRFGWVVGWEVFVDKTE
jgi:hypothetical protein